MAEKVYARRISGTEAAEKFIFITKDALKGFPSQDSRFKMVFDDRDFLVSIKAVSCDCVGRPHEHYHLMAGELFENDSIRKGSQIVIYRAGQDTYLLKTVT
jgi:hypothetical protein